MTARPGRTPKLDPSLPVYHVHEANCCPTCGGSQWWVGRLTAECVECGGPLPLAEYRRGPILAMRRAA